MPPISSSPLSSTSFPSSNTSRGHDENNFGFQTKAWPAATNTNSPRKQIVGETNNNNAPLSIQTQGVPPAPSPHLSSPLRPPRAAGSKQPHRVSAASEASRGSMRGSSVERHLEGFETVDHGWQPRPTRSANSTPLRSRGDDESEDVEGLENWMSVDNTGEPDDLEQALFEQRLTEDVYGVAVRKINQNGKSNLRYVKCTFVDAAELDQDAQGFTSSSRSVNSQNRRFGRFRSDKSLEKGSDGHLLKGKKVKVLTWGKKKEVHLPVDRFVCVRKGKTTDRTRRNICPASRILSLISDDPGCPSLDIEAPTRLDRDKFAKAFSRFLGVPLDGEDARSIRSDDNLTPQSMKGKKRVKPFVSVLYSERNLNAFLFVSEPPKSTASSGPQQQAFSSRQSLKSHPSAPDHGSGNRSNNASNHSSSRRQIPLPVPVVTTDGPQKRTNYYSQQQCKSYANRNKEKEVIHPDPQIASLPSSTHDSKPKSSKGSENRTQPTVPSLNVHPQDEEDASVVSSITGGGFDQELVEEMHVALTKLKAELEESRAEAARAVKVAEQAIQSAENSNSKDWNSTVTHKAAEAAAHAQKRSAEALAKARMAEERLEQEKKRAALWRKQAETATEEAGHWQTRAAVAEVQRAAMAETLESERQKTASGVLQVNPSASTVTVTSELDRLRSKLAMETASRRKLLNEVQDLRGAVRVYCRPRAPMGPKGAAVISTPSREVLMLHRERAFLRMDGPPSNLPMSFEFDGILGGASQHEVYEEMESVCLSALDGYKCCLMTYGQSGSGKTYTMLGDVQYDANGEVHSIADYGIHLQAAQQFFHVLSQRSDRYEETVTFNIVEVSNERLADLLVGTTIGDQQGVVESSRKAKKGDSVSADGASDKPTKLEIKTNRDGETTVHGLLSVEVGSFEEVLTVWKQSLSVRRQRLVEQGVEFDEHEANSHIIGTFKIQSKNIATGITTWGKIQFVDLAASNVVQRSSAAKKISKSEASVTDRKSVV